MHYKYKKTAFYFRKLIFFISVVILFSFQAKLFGAVVLFQGKLLDKDTGEPIGTTFRFFNSAGKKNQSQSSVSDGSYQVVLNSGDSYYFAVRNYIVVEPPASFELPESQIYAEIRRNYYLRKITLDMNLFTLKIFEANSKDILQNSSDKLKELKFFMDMNPHINLKITISSKDSYFKSSRKKVQYTDKRGRTRTKTIRVSESELLSVFSKERYDELLKKFDELKIPKGHTIFEEDRLQTKYSRKSKSKSTDDQPNVTISVYKILDFN